MPDEMPALESANNKDAWSDLLLAGLLTCLLDGGLLNFQLLDFLDEAAHPVQPLGAAMQHA